MITQSCVLYRRLVSLSCDELPCSKDPEVQKIVEAAPLQQSRLGMTAYGSVGAE